MKTEEEDDEEQKELERREEEKKERRYQTWKESLELSSSSVDVQKKQTHEKKKKEKAEEMEVGVQKRESVPTAITSSSSSSGASAGSLSASLRAAILRGLRALQQDTRCVYIVLTTCSPHLFSLGVNTFRFTDGVLETPTVEEVCQALVHCEKMTIAAMIGKCFSWGLELALCTTYRIGIERATWCAFPEVKMSLFPASLTGIQALVKRAGVPRAVQLLCTGKVLSATLAKQQYGLLDKVWRYENIPMRMKTDAPKEEKVEANGEATTDRVTTPVTATVPRMREVLENPQCVAERKVWWEAWLGVVHDFAMTKRHSSPTVTHPPLQNTVENANATGSRIPTRGMQPLQQEREWFCSSHHDHNGTGGKGMPTVYAPPLSPPLLPYPDPVTLSLLPHYPDDMVYPSPFQEVQVWSQVRMTCAWATHQFSISPSTPSKMKAPFYLVESVRLATIYFNRTEADLHWRRYRDRFLNCCALLTETKGSQHFYKCIEMIEKRVEKRVVEATMEMRRRRQCASPRRRSSGLQDNETSPVEALPSTSTSPAQTSWLPPSSPLSSSTLSPTSFPIRKLSVVAEDLGRTAFMVALVLHYVPHVSIVVVCLRPRQSLFSSASSFLSHPSDHGGACIGGTRKEATTAHTSPLDDMEGNRTKRHLLCRSAQTEEESDLRRSSGYDESMATAENVDEEADANDNGAGNTFPFFSSCFLSRPPSHPITPRSRLEKQKQFVRMKAFYSAVLDYLRLFHEATSPGEEQGKKGMVEAGAVPPMGGCKVWNAEKKKRPVRDATSSMMASSVDDALCQRVESQLRLVDAEEVVWMEEVKDGVDDHRHRTEGPHPEDEARHGAVHGRHHRSRAARQWSLGVPPSFYEADILLECHHPSTLFSSTASPSSTSTSSSGLPPWHPLVVLDSMMVPSCIFLTTTAMTDVEALSMALVQHRHHLLGAFFAPRVHPHAGVVEVNPCSHTDSIVLARMVSFFHRLSSYPVVVRPPTCGVVLCRLVFSALRQAQECVIAGCFPAEVDRALRRRIQCRIGPLALEDMWGLDWCASVREILRSADKQVDSFFRGVGNWARPPPSSFASSHSTPPVVKTDLPSHEQLVQTLIQEGHVGWRTGKGWYVYDPIAGRQFFDSADTRGRVGGGGSIHALKNITEVHGITQLKQFLSPHSLRFPSPSVCMEAIKRSISDSGAANGLASHTLGEDPAKTAAALTSSAAVFDLVPPLYVWDSHRIAQRCRKAELLSIHYCSNAGLLRRDVTDMEVTERICLAVVQDAVRMLSDGVVPSRLDIDLLSVYAMDFPPWTGGVLYESAETNTPKSLQNKVHVYMTALGEDAFPPPCRAIVEMGNKNISIRDYFPAV